jgi:hypothetical protein
MTARALQDLDETLGDVFGRVGTKRLVRNPAKSGFTNLPLDSIVAGRKGATERNQRWDFRASWYCRVSEVQAE